MRGIHLVELWRISWAFFCFVFLRCTRAHTSKAGCDGDGCDTSRMRATAATNNQGRTTLIGSVDDGGFFFSFAFFSFSTCFLLSRFPHPKTAAAVEREPVRLCCACRGAAERQQHCRSPHLSLCLLRMDGCTLYVALARSYVPVSPHHKFSPELENVAAPCSPAVDSGPASQSSR